MKYVNTSGPITSVNLCPQPGFAERAIQDDDPELLEFYRRINGDLTPDEKADRDMQSPMVRAILAAVNSNGATEARVRSTLKSAYESENQTRKG